ncbi:hypothetical protein SAMN06269185_0579 [Natronoarchaeum philippinense]|uniref:Uncharacterized protein n=1 Tax=Natronoarchaeum philippinense TaxID=558529 RepID=A0A285N4Y6_NATPI|nr:hypothetical protein [Natronoarchaeum philippinense]SNZ04490.1 hypothetical protein SAMN06269185_0579 [Natronoarchaeum philippinense]
MSDHGADDHGTDEETVEAPDSEYEEGEKSPAEARTTAPQSTYTMRDVGIGAAVTVVGLLLAFVVPFLLA